MSVTTSVGSDRVIDRQQRDLEWRLEGPVLMYVGLSRDNGGSRREQIFEVGFKGNGYC